MDKQAEAERVITALGGTGAVARICGLHQSSVSGWKTHGIPKAWAQFLRLLHPEAWKASRARKPRKAA